MQEKAGGEGAPDDRCSSLVIVAGRRRTQRVAESLRHVNNLLFNVLGWAPDERSVSVLDGRCGVGVGSGLKRRQANDGRWKPSKRLPKSLSPFCRPKRSSTDQVQILYKLVRGYEKKIPLNYSSLAHMSSIDMEQTGEPRVHVGFSEWSWQELSRHVPIHAWTKEATSSNLLEPALDTALPSG